MCKSTKVQKVYIDWAKKVQNKEIRTTCYSITYILFDLLSISCVNKFSHRPNKQNTTQTIRKDIINWAQLQATISVMCLRLKSNDCIHLTVKKGISVHPTTMFRICVFVVLGFIAINTPSQFLCCHK